MPAAEAFDWNSLVSLAFTWLPAVSTTTILGFVIFVSRTAFKAEIEKSIAIKYDTKLEALKSDLRKSEDGLKAEIKNRDDELQALRSGALSGLVSRQAALSQRRLAAIELLWSCVVEQNKLKSVSSYVTTLNLDVIGKEIRAGGPNGEKVKHFIDMLWKSMGLEGYTTTDKALNDRPFIPSPIWALYVARHHILLSSFMRFFVVKNGIDPEGMLETDKLLETTKAALPHQAPYIEKYGITGLPLLVEEIEQKLLDAIAASLQGEEADALGLQQAHAIIKRAEDMLAPRISSPELVADLERFAAKPPPHPPVRTG